MLEKSMYFCTYADIFFEIISASLIFYLCIISKKIKYIRIAYRITFCVMIIILLFKLLLAIIYYKSGGPVISPLLMMIPVVISFATMKGVLQSKITS